MDEEILAVLRSRPSDYFSGEIISRQLRVSRTAVWKRINALRSLGYKIEASRRRGYRLVDSPDLLTSAEITPLLGTRWMGRQVHCFRTVDSTNSEAYQLGMKGAPEGAIVVAEGQEKGRGRLGRTWISPPFLNLYLSVILRPKIPPQQASVLTLMAAVATAEAVAECSGLSPTIKWPNDIFLRGRKLAGLLNEIHSEADHVDFVVLGIGVNLNIEENMFPPELRESATSLKRETGQPVSRRHFARGLLEKLETWYERFLAQGNDPVLRGWREKAQLGTQRVKVTSFGETWVGRARDIDSEGALLLETEGGEIRRVVAGDVEYRRSEE